MIFQLVKKLKACEMVIYIKNMVSLRCKIMVRQELTRLQIAFRSVELGYADLLEELHPMKRMQLRIELHQIGLELIFDHREILAERIKNVINETYENGFEAQKLTFSHFLFKELETPYYVLSRIFREVTGISISKYLVRYRIERVKELLQLSELSLTEIAFRLHYSSVAHLSKQFKEVSGQCVSRYKMGSDQKRCGLDEILSPKNQFEIANQYC